MSLISWVTAGDMRNSSLIVKLFKLNPDWWDKAKMTMMVVVVVVNNNNKNKNLD